MCNEIEAAHHVFGRRESGANLATVTPLACASRFRSHTPAFWRTHHAPAHLPRIAWVIKLLSALSSSASESRGAVCREDTKSAFRPRNEVARRFNLEGLIRTAESP